jgi:hypothetical protein
MNTPAPLDVLEKLEQMLSTELDQIKKRGYDLQMLVNAKPKGKIRQLTKELNQTMIDWSREEKNLEIVREDLEKARAKAAKKK